MKLFLSLIVMVVLMGCTGSPYLHQVDLNADYGRHVGGTDNVDTDGDKIPDASSSDKNVYGLGTKFSFRFH